MYAKRGGVAAYHIVWIGLCSRSVPGVRVLASAVDDSTSKNTHTWDAPQVLTIEWSYYVHGTNAIMNSTREFIFYREKHNYL